MSLKFAWSAHGKYAPLISLNIWGYQMYILILFWGDGLKSHRHKSAFGYRNHVFTLSFCLGGKLDCRGERLLRLPFFTYWIFFPFSPHSVSTVYGLRISFIAPVKYT